MGIFSTILSKLGISAPKAQPKTAATKTAAQTAAQKEAWKKQIREIQAGEAEEIPGGGGNPQPEERTPRRAPRSLRPPAWRSPAAAARSPAARAQDSPNFARASGRRPSRNASRARVTRSTFTPAPT